MTILAADRERRLTKGYQAKWVIDDIEREISGHIHFLRAFVGELEQLDDAIAARKAELESLHPQIASAQKELERVTGELNKIRGRLKEESEARRDWKP
jgi:predicted  nucleic acid-binding Zn-ribbon protein